MDTDALRWLQQVADGTTVTEVSELEQVTQSGVSRALARLETQLGTPLLRRSGRILRLTHAGAVFKPHLDAMLHNLDDGIAAVSQLIDPDTGTVALAFQQSLGTWLVPDLVRSFRIAHPRVRFRLTQSRDEPDFVIMDGGNADLELGSRRSPDEAALSRLIAVEPLRLAVRRDHPLAGRDQVRLAEAAAEPFISLRPGSGLRRQTDELCQQAGFRPDVIFEGDDLSNVRGFVAAGLGVAVIPAPRAGSPEAVPGPVAYLEIQDEGAVRQIFLTWSAERRLLPATDLFRRHVLRRAAAGQLPAVDLCRTGPRARCPSRSRTGWRTRRPQHRHRHPHLPRSSRYLTKRVNHHGRHPSGLIPSSGSGGSPEHSASAACIHLVRTASPAPARPPPQPRQCSIDMVLATAMFHRPGKCPVWRPRLPVYGDNPR